jgi:hypothetical protein
MITSREEATGMTVEGTINSKSTAVASGSRNMVVDADKREETTITNSKADTVASSSKTITEAGTTNSKAGMVASSRTIMEVGTTSNKVVVGIEHMGEATVGVETRAAVTISVVLKHMLNNTLAVLAIRTSSLLS